MRAPLIVGGMTLSTRQLAILLAMLSALGPFAIDTYLPAFPAVAADLATTDLAIQQTLTAYMIPFAFMMLWHGPLSDALGRRPVIVGGLSLFAAASVVCALAPSVEWLLFGRALQGMVAGAGMVVARAVVRDLYDGVSAQKQMALMAVIFAIAPGIAPLIGGGLLLITGWRGIFWFLALYAGAMALCGAKLLPESLPPAKRHPFNPRSLWQGYTSVASHHRFRRLALATGLNFIGLFIYVLSAPVFLIRHLGLSSQQFAWMFIPVVCGMMVGSTLSGKLAGRRSPEQCIALAFGLMAAAAVGNVTFNLLHAPSLWNIAPLVFYACGMALAMPALQLLALDLFPERRGLASSCLGVVQTSINAFAAALLVPLLWGSTLHLALGMATCLTMGGLVYWLSSRQAVYYTERL
jgi:MFS transporter, DHA1 family, multidrug resistance protein